MNQKSPGGFQYPQPSAPNMQQIPQNFQPIPNLPPLPPGAFMQPDALPNYAQAVSSMSYPTMFTPTYSATPHEEYTWIPTNKTNCRFLEHCAVLCGHDLDGSPIYIGRTQYNNEIIPCKVIPRNNVAYFSHNTKEKVANDFEIYCRKNSSIQWIASSNGAVPVGAVPICQTSSGETLYAGRVKHRGSVTVGKVYPLHKCCYISFDGREISFNNYEVMVLRNG